MKGVVFLDRDGVICENRADYVKSWQEFVFLPNTLAALADLKRDGYRIIVVTNQSAVGRGLMTLKELNYIHAQMMNTIQQHGGYIEQVIYCPHRPEDNCDCRKPRPGMLLAAAKMFNIDLQQSYMIGDACSDLQAGQAVGCRCFFVLTGRGLAQLPSTLHHTTSSFQIVPDLRVAVKHILNNGWQAEAGSDLSELVVQGRTIVDGLG